jgi:pyridinium-3,5-bisthiocarboxylic acid mononucleotide nickel chelatase
MRIAYLDCFSGISGDMFLGALLDAGVPFALFEKTVGDLNVGATLEISRVDRGGISATKLDVVVDGEKDMPREEYWKAVASGQLPVASETAGAGGQGLGASAQSATAHAHTHSNSHGNVAEHVHSHEHSHKHDHPHEHTPSAKDHAHPHGRHLSDILKIINAAPLSERVKQLSGEIFLALGAAEAKIHNVPLEQIHFHEVGAADAIVDIVCAAVGAEALAVDRFLCSPLNVGGGTVQCAHGTMPVPAPATLELLQGAPIYSGEIQKELVTPTGAAIVKVLASSFESRPAMTTEQIGYGAGSRNFQKHANVLRISVGEAADLAATAEKLGEEQEIAILEANLDDLNPQLIGYIMELAFAEGALDVFTTPVQMKKNRPGTVLTILASLEREPSMRALLFRESSTLGVRVRREKRYALPRHHEAVVTPWGEVRMKIAGLNGSPPQYAPEYEDCRRIAVEHHVPLKHVMQEALRLYMEKHLDRKHG